MLKHASQKYNPEEGLLIKKIKKVFITKTLVPNM